MVTSQGQDEESLFSSKPFVFPKFSLTFSFIKHTHSPHRGLTLGFVLIRDVNTKKEKLVSKWTSVPVFPEKQAQLCPAPRAQAGQQPWPPHHLD